MSLSHRATFPEQCQMSEHCSISVLEDLQVSLWKFSTCIILAIEFPFPRMTISLKLMDDFILPPAWRYFSKKKYNTTKNMNAITVSITVLSIHSSLILKREAWISVFQ